MFYDSVVDNLIAYNLLKTLFFLLVINNSLCATSKNVRKFMVFRQNNTHYMYACITIYIRYMYAYGLFVPVCSYIILLLEGALNAFPVLLLLFSFE